MGVHIYNQIGKCLLASYRYLVSSGHSRKLPYGQVATGAIWPHMTGCGFGTGPIVEIAFTLTAFGEAAQLSQTHLAGQLLTPKRGLHLVRCYSISD